tara:strand:+ start:2790 stop:3104 length:315 start_codon:yes stop_codon:yes gene_type:complete
MDSYNRGYDSGIGDGPDGLGESGSIGNANILARPNEIDIADWQAAGFYAVAYQWNGETVISYRGTDDYFSWSSANDALSGWPLGEGSCRPRRRHPRALTLGSIP